MSTARKEKAPTWQCTGLDHLKYTHDKYFNTIIAFRLTGSICQCAVCGEVFNSVSVFDLHRIGSCQGQLSARRCLAIHEMAARGWSKNARGFWVRRKRSHLPCRIDDHRQPCAKGAGMNGRGIYAEK